MYTTTDNQVITLLLILSLYWLPAIIIAHIEIANTRKWNSINDNPNLSEDQKDLVRHYRKYQELYYMCFAVFTGVFFVLYRVYSYHKEHNRRKNKDNNGENKT